MEMDNETRLMREEECSRAAEVDIGLIWKSRRRTGGRREGNGMHHLRLISR